MNNVLYVISSNILYYQTTLPVIIPSLIKSGIDPLNILAVVGDVKPDDMLEQYNDVLVVGVEYNALEFTGLIYLIEHKIHRPWYFILHDTCEAYGNFGNIIQNYDIPSDATHVALYDGNYAQNIGLLSDRYLHETKRDFILDSRGRNKAWMIHHEDQIFDNKHQWYFCSCHAGNPKFLLGNGYITEDRYGNGVQRQKCDWDLINLIKWRGAAGGHGDAANGGTTKP